MTTRKSIPRDPNSVPEMKDNPAAGLIADTIEYYELSQVEVARAACVAPSFLSNVLKNKKKVSYDLAFKLEIILGLKASFLMKLQNAYDYSVAYHAKAETIEGLSLHEKVKSMVV